MDSSDTFHPAGLKRKHIFFPTENTGPAIKPGLGIPSIGRVFSIHLAVGKDVLVS